MKPFKILFFENEFSELKPSFEMVNAYFYNGMLQYKVLPKSQDLKDFNQLQEYNLIVVDIDLSSASELDGYGLILKIEAELKGEIPPIVIVSGHEKNLDVIHKHNLSKYRYVEKPIKFSEIRSMVDLYKEED